MGLFGTIFSGRGLALFFGATALSACTVVEMPGPYPGSRPEPVPRFCTREYQPVCGERGPSRQSFPNACEADRAGYRIVYPGQCRSSGGWGGGPSGPGDWGSRPPRPGPGDWGTRPPRPGTGPVACTREYAPVCATRSGAVRTFPNACEARAADYRIVDQNGPC
ncbi:Kazal-type serine protease inhibitor family protein [Pseudaminobacter sp. NGMCC 1.201702]|uniref:Kazal-type serine protease inhibitor family protein n=1 Tax=Pseudaminobacter sp. NGMCC 1.201702 TaxID=3391825 RepID=UPI0039EF7294